MSRWMSGLNRCPAKALSYNGLGGSNPLRDDVVIMK